MFLMLPSNAQPSSASLLTALFSQHLVIRSEVQSFGNNIVNPVSQPSSYIANTLCIYFSTTGGLSETLNGLLPYCEEL